MNVLPIDWMVIKKWAGSELERLTRSLCSVELTHDQTAVLRGEIKALNRLLALPERRAQEAQRTTQATGWQQ